MVIHTFITIDIVKMPCTVMHSIPEDILDDLTAQFISNLPENVKLDPVKVCFSIERAYWHYQDVLMPYYRFLKRGTMKEFTSRMFHHIKFLRKHANCVQEVVKEWEDYKSRIPTYGAIILTPGLDKVLLVKSAKGNWGFPKGKIEDKEKAHTCAAREVMEEVGLDIRNMIDKKRFLQHLEFRHICRLYIIPGIRETLELRTSCPEEIRAICWFELNLLPTCLRDESCKTRTGISSNKFYNTIPFVKEIKEWVKQERAREFNMLFERLMVEPECNADDDDLAEDNEGLESTLEELVEDKETKEIRHGSWERITERSRRRCHHVGTN